MFRVASTVSIDCLEEFFFGVDLDGAVAGGVGHAGKDETFTNLVIVKEVLLGLVDGSVNPGKRKRGQYERRNKSEIQCSDGPISFLGTRIFRRWSLASFTYIFPAQVEQDPARG